MTDPFSTLPAVPAFPLRSDSVTDGTPLAPAQWAGHDVSPHLSWSEPPEGTKSFVVTMYDPDAPTGSGFWHWAVADIPATVLGLPADAGDPSKHNLPDGAFHVPNDARVPGYVGAAPPPGHGEHRYLIVVSALDVDTIGVPPDATPAYLGFLVGGHILGRAVLTATAETPA